MSTRFELADFKPLIGQAFQIRYPDHSDTLTLLEAEAARIQLAGFPPAFSLLFEGEDRRVMLGQHIYALENAVLGRIELALIPVQPGSNGAFRYEAVFN